MSTERLVGLQVKNVRRIKALSLTPDEDHHLIPLVGRNAQGKSSVLTAIAGALGAKLETGFVNDQAKMATVVLETPNYVVKCKVSAKSGKRELILEERETGDVIKKPHAMIRELLGEMKVGLDPEAFLRLKPTEQVEAVRNVLGIDLGVFDCRIETLYQQRRDLARDFKTASARVPDDFNPTAEPQAPPAPDTSAYDEAVAKNDKNREYRRQVDATVAEAKKAVEAIEQCMQAEQAREEEITLIEKQLSDARERLTNASHKTESARTEAEKLTKLAEQQRAWVDSHCVDVEIPDMSAVLEAQKEHQSAVAQFEIHKKAHAEATRLEKELHGAEANLERERHDRAEAIANAGLPVEGLAFADDSSGLFFNGRPLEQASQAEQLSVAVALGIAANPKFRVITVRQGSLMDRNSLALLEEIAAKHDAQVFIEIVGEPGESDLPGAVYIEDGYAKEVQSGQEEDNDESGPGQTGGNEGGREGGERPETNAGGTPEDDSGTGRDGGSPEEGGGFPRS